VAGVIDADPVAASVRALMADRTGWRGTASELLAALSEVAGERTARAKDWPGTPRGLSGRLRRAATFLRRAGIEVTFGRTGHEKARVIGISRTPAFSASDNEGIQPSASSASSAPREIANVFSDLARADCGRYADGADGMRTVGGRPADGCADGADGWRTVPLPTVRTTIGANPLKDKAFSAGADGADGADAKIPTDSALEKAAPRPAWEADL
jgi:hypothetical protein